MARKSTAQLKDGPVELPKLAREYLSMLAQVKVYPGTEDSYLRYVDKARAVEEQHVRVNASPDSGDALAKLARLQAGMFGALDVWRRDVAQAKRAVRDAADPTLSNVPKETVKSLIAEEFPEAAGELDWKMGKGMMAHKLSEAIYGFVVREESQEVPLCPTCQSGG